MLFADENCRFLSQLLENPYSPFLETSLPFLSNSSPTWFCSTAKARISPGAGNPPFHCWRFPMGRYLLWCPQSSLQHAAVLPQASLADPHRRRAHPAAPCPWGGCQCRHWAPSISSASACEQGIPSGGLGLLHGSAVLHFETSENTSAEVWARPGSQMQERRRQSHTEQWGHCCCCPVSSTHQSGAVIALGSPFLTQPSATAAQAPCPSGMMDWVAESPTCFCNSHSGTCPMASCSSGQMHPGGTGSTLLSQKKVT